MENAIPGAGEWIYTYYGDAESFDRNTKECSNFRPLNQVITLDTIDRPEIVGMKHYGVAFVSIDYCYSTDGSAYDSDVHLPSDFDNLESLS